MQITGGLQTCTVMTFNNSHKVVDASSIYPDFSTRTLLYIQEKILAEYARRVCEKLVRLININFDTGTLDSRMLERVILIYVYMDEVCGAYFF